MIREFAQRMMDADVEVACNAGYGEVTPERVNSRNGYRRREWDNVHCLIATGVNADGCREILGVDVTSSEDGAGWLAFLRGLAARGLSGVQLVTSDDHAGLVSAIAAVPPGAGWQRCRTHYADLGIMPTSRRELQVAA